MSIDIYEVNITSQNNWLISLPFILLAIIGLTMLVRIATGSERKVLKLIESGEPPPKGSSISEKSLSRLASRNPEAYRIALNMVLKGDLKMRKSFVYVLRNLKSSLKGEE
ncbi:MAG: hypothetical protein ACUVQ0_02440 [Thermoproteota archaeon]